VATREELYQKFGPKLLEAIVRIMLIEINTLRSQLGLPERTPEQAISAIDNELDALADYDWMRR
jgi:hypothetical protein